MFHTLIKRPIAVMMVLTAVMVLGIAAIRKLPVSLVPEVDIPRMTVQVTSPERSAREINELLLSPLRAQLVQVPHLEELTCTAKDGSGIIEMTFAYGSDADYLFIDVSERVDRAMNGWPQEEERPMIARASATDIPAFFINVSLKGDRTAGGSSSTRFLEMSDFTRQVIVRRLEQLPQVAMVDLSGLTYPQLLIIPDMEKLRALGADERTLSQAIQGANVRLGSLSIRDGEYRFDVRFESTVVTRQDVEQVWLKLGGRTYQIKDLAQVREEEQDRKGMVASDGSPCIAMAVIKRADARMADLRDGIYSLIEAFRTDYPDLQFTVTRDQTELLEYSIDSMVRSLLLGALFACIIIFLFMQDLRSPLLVVITIPSALILSFLFFHVLKISINIISLSGLVLGLGMMVDNSIITIDNITQRWQKGSTLADACVSGTQEVFPAMLSSVLTTCALFIPLIFMSGIAGALFYDEAMAVTITLVSALVVSVLLIPVLYYRFYSKKGTRGPLQAVPSGERRWLTALDGWHTGAEEWLLRHRGIAWTLSGMAVILSVPLFMALDRQRLPEMSHTDSLLTIEWNERITAQENDRRCRQVTSLFQNELTQYTSMAGAQQFALSHTPETGLTGAIIYMKAETADGIGSIEKRACEYIADTWPSATASCGASSNIFDMLFQADEQSLVARLRLQDGSTPSPEQLTALLSCLRNALQEAESDIVRDVRLQQPEWNEHIELVTDAERLALYDVSFGQIMSYLRNAMNAGSVLRISRGDVSMPVVIGVGNREARDLIEGSYIETGSGRVPLEVLLKETRARDLKQISSGMDGEYYPVPLDLKGRHAREAMEIIRQAVKGFSEETAQEFDVSFSGSYFSGQQTVRELTQVLLISLLLLFFILAAQFESMVQPLIIMSELVIDIFCVLLVLWVSGMSLNLMSMIGLVVMCGIVINDSILKVDTINRLRHEGADLKRAILEAGSRRLKAILMTSLTTILATCPMLARGSMGSDLQFPLALTLIIGMVIGTLISIFFVPLAYYVIYRRK